MNSRKVVITLKTKKALEQMGAQIKLARLRRQIPATLVAERAGISRQTVSAIEKGSPTVSMGAYAAVLHALNGMEGELTKIAADDEFGRHLQDLGLSTRKRAPSRTK